VDARLDVAAPEEVAASDEELELKAVVAAAEDVANLVEVTELVEA